MRTYTTPPSRPILFDEEAERQLLGCLLVDVDLRRHIRRLIRLDDFSLYHHRAVYQAVLHAGDAPFYAIADLLQTQPLVREMGGEGFIRRLAVQVDNYADGFALARRVAKLGKQRRVLRLAEDMARAAVDGNIDGLNGWVNRRLMMAIRNALSLENAGEQIALPGVMTEPKPAGQAMPAQA
jgi:replicative DNA helicase